MLYNDALKIQIKIARSHSMAKQECHKVSMLHSISNRFFQCFSYIIDRVHQNSPSMHSYASFPPLLLKLNHYICV